MRENPRARLPGSKLGETRLAPRKDFLGNKIKPPKPHPMKEPEAYFALWTDDGFEPGFNEVPGKRQYIAAKVSTQALNDYGVFEFFGGVKKTHRRPEVPRGDLWWEDGMMSKVTHVVYLVTDDISHGIFIFYNPMDRPGLTQFLGRLIGSPLYTKAERAFRKVVKELK